MDPTSLDLYNQIANLRDNHIKHLADDIVTLKINMARVTSDIRWLMIIGGFIIVESTGILITILLK